MNASANAAGLGLLSAASWGGSDFIGGLGARRAPTLLVVAAGHAVSLLVLLAYCLGAHLPFPGARPMIFTAVGGFEGAIALAVFYRALAMGAMGLTAALTGLLTALVPVLFSLFHDGLPTRLVALGLVLGLAAIWLIALGPGTPAQSRSSTPAKALLYGVLAGIGFGAQLILFKFASGGNILWVMTGARAAGVTAMLLVLMVMPPKAPWRGFWLFGILAGTFDTLGNLLYIETTRIGRLDVAATVCSLYPAGTILLAALVLREWPSLRQWFGMGLALAAVVLLSL